MSREKPAAMANEIAALPVRFEARQFDGKSAPIVFCADEHMPSHARAVLARDEHVAYFVTRTAEYARVADDDAKPCKICAMLYGALIHDESGAARCFTHLGDSMREQWLKGKKTITDGNGEKWHAWAAGIDAVDPCSACSFVAAVEAGNGAAQR